MNEKLPFVSVVDASTLPEGLINTTTTFALPPLLASSTRPLSLTIERRRDAAARAESSEDAGVGDSVGVVVGFAGVDPVAPVGTGSGDGEGTVVGVVLVSLGFVVSDDEGVGDFSGFGELGDGSEDVGFEVTSDERVAAAVDSGLATGEGADVAANDVAPIFSSRPCNDPFTRR